MSNAANALSALGQYNQLNGLVANARNNYDPYRGLSGLVPQSQTVALNFDTKDLPEDLRCKWVELIGKITEHLIVSKPALDTRAAFLATLGLTPEDIGE